MVNEQPEALRLADMIEACWAPGSYPAAAELRRLHESNTELLVALKEVYTTCDWHGDDGQEAMMKARAAIARAERKTP